jgi:competence protein ComEC
MTKNNSPFSRGLGGASRILPTLLTILTFLTLGIYRAQSTIHIPSPATIDYYTQESSPSSPNSQSSQTLTGIIAEEPDVRRDKINYTIAVQTLYLESGEASPDKGPGVRQEIPLSGYTLISAGKYPAYQFGDTLELTGNLQKPVVFDTFDYAGYLSRFDIYSVMYRPRIELIESANHYRPYFASLLSVKKSFEQHLNLTYPSEPTSSFMAGLLLGSRKGMPEELTADFQTTGLTHIVAISGYNITLVVSILMAIFKPFGKRISILLAALGIILFTLFVGATPAVVRACIMGLIALLALNSERKGNITIILALTASLMIGYNPKILIYDVGFQLSFLATMGLIYVSPILEPYLKRLPKKLAIRDSINLSLSAQIMALPIIVLNFQNLSLISPISNLLVAGPFIPFSMLFGFVGTMASYISIALGKIIAFPGYLLLQYIVHMIEFTADIPYAAVSISWFSKSMLFIYFIGLSGVLYRWWKKDQQREETIRKFQLLFEHRVVEQLWLKT